MSNDEDTSSGMDAAKAAAVFKAVRDSRRAEGGKPEASDAYLNVIESCLSAEQLAAHVENYNDPSLLRLDILLPAAILAKPGDDLPRMVYADWLDEHDNPDRAEFIRVQINLANSPRSPLRSVWEEREKKLLKKHKEEWARQDLLERHCPDVVYSRGFIDHVKVYSRDFATHGENWLARAPITSIKVLDSFEPQFPHRSCSFDEFLHLPFLHRIRKLDLFMTHRTSADCQTLANTEWTKNLLSLCLGANDFGDNGVAALANSPYLKNLQSLGLPNCSLTNGGLAIISESPNFAHLKHLDLLNSIPNYDITIEGLNTLAHSPHLRDLERLDLSYANISSPELTQFFAQERHNFSGRRFELVMFGERHPRANAIDPNRDDRLPGH